MGRVQRQRQAVHPKIATAAALGSVAAAVVAVLAFVVGIFDDEENGTSSPELIAASDPVIRSLVHVPPSAIGAAGISGPVSDEQAIYLVARRPEDGEVVASTIATLAESSEGELRWRALLELKTSALGVAVKAPDGPVPYEVLAAVMPKSSGFSIGNSTNSSGNGNNPFGNSYSSNANSTSTGASGDSLDLDNATAVSAPQTISIP